MALRGLTRGRWLWGTLAILAMVLLFLRLGTWQLERLATRRAANALILARMEQPLLTLTGAPLDPEADNLRRASVRGTFDYAQEMVLRNRTLNEIPGVHVLTPLRISGVESAILVDRGWIPYEFADPALRAQFRGPAGEVDVEGILRQTQTRRGPSPVDPPLGPDRPRLDAWHRVDLPHIQEQLPYPLLSLFLEAEAAAADNPRSFPRPDPDVSLSEGSHLVYAIQWFSFAAILVLGYGLAYARRGSRT